MRARHQLLPNRLQTLAIRHNSTRMLYRNANCFPTHVEHTVGTRTHKSSRIPQIHVVILHIPYQPLVTAAHAIEEVSMLMGGSEGVAHLPSDRMQP